MELKGVAHVFGDNINTDLIIAGKYTKTQNMNDLAEHCFEDLDPDFRKRVKKGDFVVAGYNFGCGSSREQAPVALKYSGVAAVIARSFARIFYRNAINIVLPAIICDTSSIKNGDYLTIDLAKGEVIVNNKQIIRCQPFPPIMQDILECGGLVPYLREKGDYTIN